VDIVRPCCWIHRPAVGVPDVTPFDILTRRERKESRRRYCAISSSPQHRAHRRRRRVPHGTSREPAHQTDTAPPKWTTGRYVGIARLISHQTFLSEQTSNQPAVLFSQNKPVTSNQPAVLFSQNKSAPAISHQPNKQAVGFIFFAYVSSAV
jgi:hypothetical protein